MTIADSRVVAFRWKFFEEDAWRVCVNPPVGADESEALVPLSLLAETESQIVNLENSVAAMRRTRDEMQSNLIALQSRLDAVGAEVTRLTQLVSGGKGGLPDGAVAWLDMGKGEASITFNKKHGSNRASKRNAMELFNRVPAGYYPLYLSPQNEELRAALGCATTGEGG